MVGGYLFFRLDDEVRRFAERKLADHYKHLVVQVGSARLLPAKGVAMYDVSLAERSATGEPVPILTVAEVRLEGPFRVETLLRGAAHADRVVVIRPVLHATRRTDGGWNLERLLPPPKSGGPPSPVEVRDATLMLHESASRPPLIVRGLHLRVTPEGGSGSTPANSDPPLHQVDSTSRTAFAFEGGLEGALAERIAVHGRVGPTGDLRIDLNVHGLAVSDCVIAALPGLPIAGLGGVKFQALLDAQLKANRAAADSSIDWELTFNLRDGQVAHPRLPRRLTEVAATGRCDPRALNLRDLSGKLGAAEFRLALNRSGWTIHAPVSIAAAVSGLPIDPQLLAAAPPGIRNTLERFRPAGTVDLQATAAWDGAIWRPTLKIACTDVSFEDTRHFPYRLSGATGEIAIRAVPGGDSYDLDLALQGKGDGGPVGVRGELRGLDGKPGGPTPGWVQIDAPQTQITESLLAALPNEAEPAVRMLEPRGAVAAVWRMEQLDPTAPRPTTSLDLELIDCQMRFQKFPYPLNRVRGMVRQRNQHWTVENVGCELGPGQSVVAVGSKTSEPGGSVLRLRLTGTQVALDETLRASLPASAQQAWAQLQPQGSVDFVSDIEHTLGSQTAEVTISATPNQRSVSIQPTCFPLRLEKLDGRFVFSGGNVQVTGLRGVHGQTAVAADALWSPAPGRGWRLVLDKIFVDRLTTERELLAAVPPELRRTLERVRPKGSMSVVGGAMVLDHPGAVGACPRAEWKLELDCLRTDLDFGAKLENVSGGLLIEGRSDGAGSFSRGELRLDSAFYQGFQATNIRGPFWGDSKVCVFGRGVSAKDGRPAVPVEADIYDGKLELDARILHGARPQYYAQAAFQQVDLGRLAREALRLPGEGAGQAQGRLDIRGQGESLAGVAGQGEVHIRDAQYFKLPLLVSLLKVLRARAPDDTAFYGCDALFELHGTDVEFQRLDLLGDALSLYGRGRVNFDKELDLLFHSVVGPAESGIPLVRNLMGRAGEQLLQLNVTGTLDAPQFRREALPVVGNVLEQLQQGLAPESRAAALRNDPATGAPIPR